MQTSHSLCVAPVVSSLCTDASHQNLIPREGFCDVSVQGFLIVWLNVGTDYRAFSKRNR